MFFPGVQGGPHNHTIAGIAVALEKAKSQEFKNYAHQTVANAKALATELKWKGFRSVSGSTEKQFIFFFLHI